MGTFEKLSSWFQQLSKWKKALFIFLMVTLIVGPFLEPPQRNNIDYKPSNISDSGSVQGVTSKNLTIEEYLNRNKWSLWGTCRYEVKKKLKTPSSADFPMADFTTMTWSGRIVIKSFVDSDNDFWAKIRSEFKCYFDFDGSEANIKETEIF